ncbi:olfactory receptor 14K1-like [Tachyglossus aculeatus]|uniref:olfactory receptor 14K1-like n=1 Tax=Tachyglossus aculeatus TaxID=9261 RepID=UPI0018F619C5|nr:olfactory receptor 14K1-like [Tachyglossus aculeatus]
MPATEGWAKSFFTCVPHLIVVTVFFSTGAIAYFKPVSYSLSTLDLLVSALYTVAIHMVNHTVVTAFLLPGFSEFFYDVPSLLKISCSEMHTVVDVSVAMGISFGFVSFISILVFYIVNRKTDLKQHDQCHQALTGNLLFIAVAVLDRCLHTSMNFFLKHLSLFDFCFISVTAPKSIINSMSNRREVCFEGCVAQVFLEILFVSSELSIHTAMSYNSYAAICHPQAEKGNLLMVVVSTLNQCLHTSMCFFLRLLSFSDLCLISVTIPKSILDGLTDRGEISLLGFSALLVLISCSETHAVIDVSGAVDIGFGFISFVSIVVSNIRIFTAVLRFPSPESWANAFANCLPYLDFITVFCSTGSVAYLEPVSDFPSTLDLLLSMFYSEVPLP